jgi:hypothetical protein
MKRPKKIRKNSKMDISLAGIISESVRYFLRGLDLSMQPSQPKISGLKRIAIEVGVGAWVTSNHQNRWEGNAMELCQEG